MPHGLKPRTFWLLCLAGIIAAGILSRVVHTGARVFDKYLGDALYAAMLYVILRLFGISARVPFWSMIIMTAIELFQLTMIPARMAMSGHLLVKICGRLMGTEFSFWDLFAYAVGIGCMYLVDVFSPWISNRRAAADDMRIHTGSAQEPR